MPLFIEELTKTVVESGIVTDAGDRYAVAGPVAPLAIPTSLHASAPQGVTKSAHGVRKIGATRAANNGATVAELEAIFGWNGGRMASLYTRAAR